MKTMWLFLAMAVGMISPVVMAEELIADAEIRRLVQAGEILPLESILKQYPPANYGRLLDLEVEREYGRIIYELEFLDPHGTVREYEVDAKSGRLLKVELEE